MKQNLLFGFLLIFTFSSFSQNSKFSIEANYPITIDNNFLGDDSYGIIDLGLKYRFTELNPIKIGVSLNGGVLIDNSNQNNSPQDFLVTIYIIQPKVFAELNVESVEKLHPFLGLGYTFMNFQLSGSNNGMNVSGESDNLSGFGFNFGVAYDISNKIFVQVQYDFTKLNADDVPDIKFNTNVNLLKIGIGLKI
ncbi:Outer membrane protein beta-barrel domain-containing protein [Hyunsoonleella jejuensis]|uniref:Outer membrane protein beta-barrel domain-containing protein n=1 Tax=Hyunsoonleella jejuensis TaxID=419940 RepID=A0A1H9AKJ0_9FLAO|nr:outer membrane beta-barrel protein [Hyunsoonleella jejuensis]SEP76883.1 Outer membrane protein beta-barrel domain-containing protein [Hyunsoonleella jejuensis]